METKNRRRRIQNTLSQDAENVDDKKEQCETTVTHIHDNNCSSKWKGFSAPVLKNVILAVLIVLLVAVPVQIIIANSLSISEEYALNIVKEYQRMLKDPDSLILRSDIIVIKCYSEDDGHKTYCYFDASAKNGFGATVSSTACFIDGSYFCDFEDIPDIEELANMDPVEAQEYLHVEIRLRQWALFGEKCSEEVEAIISAYTVDASKIARKLKITAKPY